MDGKAIEQAGNGGRDVEVVVQAPALLTWESDFAAPVGFWARVKRDRDPFAGGPPSEVLETLSVLRAEVQSLRDQLALVRAGSATIPDSASYVTGTVADVQKIVATISDRHEAGRRIHNLWERMRDSPVLKDPAGADKMGSAALLQHLNRLDDICRDMVFQIGLDTIPGRLNAWLAGSRSGHCIPFHQVFRSEMPDEEDRQRLLDLIALRPRMVRQGIVEPSRSLVYRHSGIRVVNVAKTLAVLGIVVVLHGVLDSGALRAGPFDVPTPWLVAPEGSVASNGALWLALLVGVLFHLVVSAAKRAQSSGTPISASVGTLTQWVDARFAAILLKLAVSVFLVVVSRSVFPDAEVTIVNAFLAGYGMDSVVEIAGAAAERRAGARAAALRTRLSD